MKKSGNSRVVWNYKSTIKQIVKVSYTGIKGG
jgi:hypothetical protein